MVEGGAKLDFWLPAVLGMLTAVPLCSPGVLLGSFVELLNVAVLPRLRWDLLLLAITRPPFFKYHIPDR